MGSRMPTLAASGPCIGAALVWRPAGQDDRTATPGSQAERGAQLRRLLATRGEPSISQPGLAEPAPPTPPRALKSASKAAPMTTKVKICGLKTEAALDAALAGGADYVGLVFFRAEPAQHRSGERPSALAAKARGRAKIVALLVDPDDAL